MRRCGVDRLDEMLWSFRAMREKDRNCARRASTAGSEQSVQEAREDARCGWIGGSEEESHLKWEKRKVRKNVEQEPARCSDDCAGMRGGIEMERGKQLP
mmetsp:Transcript_12417/g.33502  ORF Transcript_12417/g.33502 Transcript_12417/m.33502 type:complete len:99 (-) Transcript_12417:253-549(-)